MRFGTNKSLILDPKVNGYEVRMYFTDKPGERHYRSETIETSEIWRLIEFVQDCEKLRRDIGWQAQDT